MRHNGKQQRLADFESTVLSSIWDEAQDIMYRGGVTDLIEADRSFWTARVFDGDRSYEVEILLEGKRIKGFTCDCWIEHRNLMCKHVAAGAGALRQYLDLKAAERRAIKLESTPLNTSDKLNIATIIKRTPPEAIAKFVQEYASEDKAFATLFKSRFASWLSGDTNYYRSILDGLIPEKHQGTLSPNEQRKVQRIVDDLVRQQKAAVAESDMQKAWLINEGLINALPRMIGKMHEMYREPYQGIFQNAFLYVLRLSKEQVSPELWERRLAFVFEMMDHPLMSDNALRLMITAMAKENAFWDGVNTRFQEAEPPVPFGILSAYIALLVHRKLSGGLPDVFKHFVSDREIAVRLVLQLYHLNNWKEALACGRIIAAEDNLSLLHKNTIGQVMLACATKLGDTKEIMSLLAERFYQSSNMDYYDQMKEASAEKWSKNFEKIVQHLTKVKDFRLLCLVFMQEKAFDRLFGLLEDRSDFALIHQIEKPLFVHQTERLISTYVQLFSAYLEAHFGTPSADFVRGHLLSILKQGGNEVAQAISVQLSDKYSDRTALIEAFQDIFPKYRRMIKPFIPKPRS